MKKLCAVLTSCLMVFSLTTPIFATEDVNVWIDENDFVVEESTVSAGIYTDGKNADGELVITYNKDELSITENDIVASGAIEMYSANIVEDGTLKIAYLTKGDEDVLFTINFNATTEELSEDAIGINGTVYDNDGKELTLGVKEKVVEEPENPENPSEPSKPGDSADTGDNYNVGFYGLLALLALACIVVIRKSTKQTSK